MKFLKLLDIAFVKTKEGKVKARVDVHFEGFTLKGFKIIQDEETKKEFVTPPSYPSPKGWRPLFKTDETDDWNEIQKQILNEYETKQMEEYADTMLTEEN